MNGARTSRAWTLAGVGLILLVALFLKVVSARNAVSSPARAR